MEKGQLISELQPAIARRAYCETCCRPRTTCLCDLVASVATTTEVIVWQHPGERNHPKGSAGLLHLCLPNSRVLVGERCSPQWLGIDQSCCALLYPDLSKAAPVAHPATIRQLLVIDGTWRKSRKMVHVNPWLAELPRLPITAVASAYRIRKSREPYQLSTFEATVSALQILEPSPSVSSLGRVFAEFVDRVAQYQPAAKRPR